METDTKSRKFLEGSRVVDFWDTFDHSRMLHNFRVRLAGGFLMQFYYTRGSLENEPELGQRLGVQALVWKQLLNQKLKKGIVLRVYMDGKGQVELKLMGGMYMQLPEEELFDDATLAALVMYGASR